MTIIAKIILCMVAASILGFIIGWIFSSLVRNEKHQKQLTTVRERFDIQKAHISQLETKIDEKNRELVTKRKQYRVLQNEIVDSQKNTQDVDLVKNKISDLEAENIVLIEQIKEQKVCEDENNRLKTKLTSIKDEKQKLLAKIEGLKEFESSYKENIHRIAELESLQKQDIKKKKKKKKSKKKENLEKKKSKEAVKQDDNEKNIYLDSVDEVQNDDKKDIKISQIINKLFTNTKD